MASGSGTKSIRDVLTQSRPRATYTMRAKITIVGRWPAISSDRIRNWEDFSLGTLNESYGPVLDFVPSAERSKEVKGAQNGSLVIFCVSGAAHPVVIPDESEQLESICVPSDSHFKHMRVKPTAEIVEKH